MSAKPAKRYVAHEIVVGDAVYRMSVLTILADGRPAVEPFNREVPATVFVNGRISVELNDDGSCRSIYSDYLGRNIDL